MGQTFPLKAISDLKLDSIILYSPVSRRLNLPPQMSSLQSRLRNSSPSSSSTMKSAKNDASIPSITPQRKHRKLLKDGSGTEVWPEHIEKVFVSGLREYWDSPYATYSQSRGRSRWRNQFLVDYLGKHGVERTKKQVASHIQVLRNMWKGEPEFSLVAGGDELYADNDSPVPASPVKLEEHYDSNNLIPFEWEESEHPNPISPDFSPADSQSEFPPTPEHRPNLFPSDFGHHPKLHGIGLDLSYQGIGSPSTSPEGNYIHPLPAFHDSYSMSPIEPKYTGISPLGPQIQAPYHAPPRRVSPEHTQQSVSRHSSVTPTHQQSRPLRNKITNMFLHADGMTPFSVKVDALAHPSAQVQPPFSLRVKLCVPVMQDPRTPSTFQGFLGGIALDNVWSVSGRCTTKVFENTTCISEEVGYLSIANINVGTVNALLPESPITRCRWLNPTTSVTITQEIVVDDETLLFVIYDLDRRNGGPMPSVSLMGYQKYRAADNGTTPIQTSTSVSPSPNPMLSTPHGTSYGRPTPQHSLSYSLSPMRYPSSSGLNY
ncbi:hypothetical protein CPB83DRAFT_589012 [Crepidotus variabilis]|uniref:TEA domain-containing protein n=1 Tax=Crepidotus variabilis TaxID=179855 RepID=A0A9P6EQ64_9AGAR|nr:hypothetical protein CPB83DRAFT_589012 [Crepidotus variabilis]